MPQVSQRCDGKCKCHAPDNRLSIVPRASYLCIVSTVLCLSQTDRTCKHTHSCMSTCLVVSWLLVSSPDQCFPQHGLLRVSAREEVDLGRLHTCQFDLHGNFRGTNLIGCYTRDVITFSPPTANTHVRVDFKVSCTIVSQIHTSARCKNGEVEIAIKETFSKLGYSTVWEEQLEAAREFVRKAVTSLYHF